MKTIRIYAGTCRHPLAVPVSHVAEIDSDTSVEFVAFRLKPRRWVRDTWGDEQWHGHVVADRADVAALMTFTRKEA